MIDKGLQTFKRFPFAVFSSILMTCIAMYFIEVEPYEIKGLNLVLMKLATTAMLGVFVFTAFRLAAQNLSKRGQIFAFAISVIGLIGYYLSLPNAMHGFNAMIYMFKHIFLILLFFVAILWAPFLKSNLPNVDYWEYAKEVLFSLVMTVLFSIIVIIGINVALYAVEALFDFYIKGKYYLMVDVFIIGLFSVTYFLSQIPQNPLASKATLPPPKVEKFFTQYILTPLTGLYFVILYTYTAKVLVTMDWPKGILAWLIVAFSIVAVLTYLFWLHFSTNQNAKWRKWIWLAILLQTFMLFIAIGMRIADYSWTENRYMVVVLGIWLAGISVYFLLFKEAKIKWIFVSLSVLIGISQVGPFSAYNVSKKAQTARLQQTLDAYKQEKSYGNVIPIKERYEISDITQYLYDRYGTKVLAPIFPKITAEFNRLDAQVKKAEKVLFKKREKELHKVRVITSKGEYEKINKIFQDKPRYFPHFVTHELGFKFVNFWEYQNYGKTKVENINFSVDMSQARGMRAHKIRGYDYMLQYYGNSTQTMKINRQRNLWRLSNIDVNIALEQRILKIQNTAGMLEFDIGSFIDKLVKKNKTSNKPLTQEELTLVNENDTLKVKIEFQHLNQNNYNGKKNLNFNALILFKMKGKK
jgi:hypothetical protein